MSVAAPALVYLDSAIVIYAVEGPSAFQRRAHTHLATLRSAGDGFAYSDLTRLECRVKPLRISDAALLTEFDNFFHAAGVVKVSLTTAVYDRATRIRATHCFKLGDALHLAAAVEAGCTRFLTNDLRLASFPDLPVEVLP